MRIGGEKASLAIKGCTQGAVRSEYEYDIPVHQARELLNMCDGPILEKIRYSILVEGLRWEIDEFLGENAGLVVAEVELQNENQTILLPDWVDREVTGDARYYNSNLCRHPYRQW